MGRDVKFIIFFSQEDLDFYRLRENEFPEIWKEGTTEDQKVEWYDKYDYDYLGGWQELNYARNEIPHMYRQVFSYRELYDRIKELLDEMDFKAVKWLSHIINEVPENGFVMIDSC